MKMHKATCVITLLAVFSVGTAMVSSHSSTETPTTSTSTVKSTTTKRSVTEELEDKYTLGDKPTDTSDEDDSDEVVDEPLPTLKPTKSSLTTLMLPVDLVPPKLDAETFSEEWNSQPIKPTQEPNKPFGLLVIKIIEIVKPKAEQVNCPESFLPLKLKQSNNNNYKPMYSSTMTADDMSSEEKGEKMPVTPQLREYNSVPTYSNSYNNYPQYTPFRFASNNLDKPWFNIFRNYNY